MRTYFDCFPCFLKQTSRTGIILNMDEAVIWDLIKRAGHILADMDVQNPPPQNAVQIYDIIVERSGDKDPFREIKRQSTLHCLSLYQELKRNVERSADPLETAIRYAACGNIIDYGVGSTFDITGEIEAILEQAFHVWEYELFKSRLEEASFVLYLGDNCGETVFDRILIETMDKPVIFVVRDGPIINDVTLEDARQAALDRVSTVISSGCRAPGIILEWASEKFSRIYESAPLIISKGQGNFETLSDERREIFFLFKIKCRVVTDYIRCPMNSMFFGRSSGLEMK